MISTNELLSRVEHCRAQLDALRSGRMKTRVFRGLHPVDSTQQTIAELQDSLDGYVSMLSARTTASK